MKKKALIKSGYKNMKRIRIEVGKDVTVDLEPNFYKWGYHGWKMKVPKWVKIVARRITYCDPQQCDQGSQVRRIERAVFNAYKKGFDEGAFWSLEPNYKKHLKLSRSAPTPSRPGS